MIVTKHLQIYQISALNKLYDVDMQLNKPQQILRHFGFLLSNLI